MAAQPPTVISDGLNTVSTTIPSLVGSGSATAPAAASPAAPAPLSSTPPSASVLNNAVANVPTSASASSLSAPPSPSVVKSSSKNEDSFRLLFDLAEDKLLDDYSCALQLKSLLLHGRLYISDRNICFYANILGRKTTKIVPYSKVLAVYKRNTAIVFSNAIEIVTRKTKYFFSSFMFRDGAYKTLTTAWSEITPDTVGRVILKAEGAELFLKPAIAGDIPSATSSSTDEDSSEDTDAPIPLTASPVKMSSSSPALPIRTRKSADPAFSLDQLVELTGADATNTSTVAATADGAATPTGDGSPSQTKKARRSSQPVETLLSGNNIPVKKRKKSTGSRSKGSISARRDADATVQAAAKVLEEKVLQQQEEEQKRQQQDGASLSTPIADDDWTSVDKVLQNPADSKKNGPTTSRARTNSSGRSNGSDVATRAAAPVSLSAPPVVELPVKSPTLMNQYDESQIESFLAVKPPVREVPCVHIVDSKSDSGTVSTLAETELKNLTVQQFYLLFWHNPQWWEDWSRVLEWTECSFTDWQLTPDGCCLVRHNNFRMPLKSIGPKSTRVESEVHLKFKNKYHMVVETTAVSKDVPFGEAFTSHEKWSVIQSGQNLKIHVTLSVRWKKAAWGFRSTIEKKTHEGTKAQVDLWFQTAQPIIDQYHRGMKDYEDQKERAKLATNAPLTAASLQSTTSALTASVSALQQLSTSDSDSENEDAQQDKKDQEVMRHIRRNSSLAGDMSALASLQPSPRTPMPTASILHSHSRRASETSRPFASEFASAASSLSSSTLGNDSSSTSSRRRFDMSSFLASLSPTTIAICAFLLVLIFGVGYFFIGGSAVEHASTAASEAHMHTNNNAPYILFLETLVASLLRNISEPASFVRQEEIYFKASKELEQKLHQLAVFSAEMAAQLKSRRLAQEELASFLATNSGDPVGQSSESALLQHFNSHDSVRKSFEAAAHLHKPALSQAIRSSPWHIYLLYVVGSLAVASGIALAVLRFSGVAAPRIPFLSDLL